MNPIVLGLLRHAVGFLAAWLVTKGYIAEGQTEQLIGVVLGIVALAWSIFDKVKNR